MKKIIDEYKYSIRKIIKNITGSYNEDLEQEVFIKTWKNSNNYCEKNKFKQWINQIAANTSRDYLRSKSFKSKMLQESDDTVLTLVKDNKFSPEKTIDQKDRQKTIYQAIEKLPNKLKQVVILFDMHEKSYEEIAKIINCPVGTVKSRLFNARKQLSIYLKDLI